MGKSITGEQRLAEFTVIIDSIADSDPDLALKIAERIDSGSYGIAVATAAQGMEPEDILPLLDAVDAAIMGINKLEAFVKGHSSHWKQVRAMKTVLLPAAKRTESGENGEKKAKATLADRVRELTQGQ